MGIDVGSLRLERSVARAQGAHPLWRGSSTSGALHNLWACIGEEVFVSFPYKTDLTGETTQAAAKIAPNSRQREGVLEIFFRACFRSPAWLPKQIDNFRASFRERECHDRDLVRWFEVFGSRLCEASAVRNSGHPRLRPGTGFNLVATLDFSTLDFATCVIQDL